MHILTCLLFQSDEEKPAGEAGAEAEAKAVQKKKKKKLADIIAAKEEARWDVVDQSAAV